MPDGSNVSPSNIGVNRSALHQAALDYAAAGIPVFPCVVNGKEPATSHSFKDASADPSQIDAWWGSNPNFNIAVEPERMGCAVIDGDPRNGGEATLASLELPETFTIRTPGGGPHLWYRGSLPPSVGKDQHKLGPGVDTRGRGGYVLLPPSYVVEKDKGYEGTYVGSFPPDDWELTDLPDWVAGKLNREREPLPAPKDFSPDTPRAYAAAYQEVQAWIMAGKLPTMGGRNVTVASLAAKLHGIGVSDATAVELISETYLKAHGAEAPDEPVDYIVASAFKSAQNPAGSELPKTGQETFGAAITQLAAEQEATQGARRERFPIFQPHEYEAVPELEFWDAEKTLPRSPDGMVLILYGEWGSHKTNTVLTMIFDAILNKGAKVLYAAGEGAHGVGKQRIPAHCKARGITTRDLANRLGIMPAVPLFASADDVAAFIEAQQEFAPNIVVIDTLATAIAGEDENGSRAAAFLTANGPAGRIRAASNALVILPAHSGKDESRGVRGNSGFGGNADVVLHVESDDSGAIKLTVDKMRDGRGRFSIYFKVPPRGSSEVPVPVRITEAEYGQLKGTGSRDGDEQLGGRVAGLLRQRGCFGFGKGLEDQAMAEALVEFQNGERPTDPDLDTNWTTAVLRQKEALQKAGAPANPKKWARGLFERRALPGGTMLIRRWCLPEDEAPGVG